MKILCLHGFLQTRSVLKKLEQTLPKYLKVERPCLWKSFEAIENPEGAFSQWARVQQEKIGSEPYLVWGYSMGARLAMHLLTQPFSSALGGILISGHYGLTTEEERQERWTKDAFWREKLCELSFLEFQREWEAQTVFQGSRPVVSNWSGIDRLQIAKGLDHFSLGRQVNMRTLLSQLKLPVLEIVGESDHKFCEMIKSRVRPMGQNFYIMPKAGHRVFWDQPDTSTRVFLRWLSSILAPSSLKG